MAGGAIEARALAVGTGAAREILGQLLAHRDRFGLAIAALEIRQDALEGVLALGGATLAVEVTELDFVLAAAMQQHLLDRVRQLVVGRFDVEIVVLRERLNHLKVVGVAPVPAANRAAREAQVRMIDDALRIEELLDTESVAGPGRRRPGC